MQDLQFYPTGAILARKAFNKFLNKRVTRLLEPSAGRGDLLLGFFESLGRWTKGETLVDCVEMDLNNQAILRDKKIPVVGSDFLNFWPATIYSHILMNPPFLVGAKHVLHAWELLYNGELVAIVNAETVKNPFSKERQLLANLIEDHSASEVEYLKEAFLSPDTDRTTAVEIAIIHLVKKSNSDMSFITDLRRDVTRKWGAPQGVENLKNQLMLPSNELENRVLDFRCAVEAMIQSEDAKARYLILSGRLEELISETQDKPIEAGEVPKSIMEGRNERVNKAYCELKKRAWSGVLKSTQVTDKLSVKARNSLNSQFEEVSQLEFDLLNIIGFIQGLVSQQGQIQTDMMCDVFDLFTRYHHDNRCYYQGWKSNSKHKTCAYKIKMSRMVIPAHDRHGYTWRNQLSYEDTNLFNDIDRVFAMLEGKHADAVSGLSKLFGNVESFKQLCQGARLSSDYFDVRFYPNAGTFHLFPRRADLIDRLNRTIGKHRNWLPHDESAVSAEFWQQYEKAEKVTGKIQLGKIDWWKFHNGEEEQKYIEHEKVHAALIESQAACGLTPWVPALSQTKNLPVAA